MDFAGAILYVRDVRASLAFYERAFGFVPAFVSDDASFGALKTGGATLGFATLEQSRHNWKAGVRETDPKGAPPAFEVWVSASDVPAAYQRALGAGAVSLAAPDKKPWGQVVAFVRDIDGHVVEISTPWTP